MAEQAESNAVATTALFVELVVIGAGTTGAACVALASAVGWDWLRTVSDAGPLVLGVTALVYVLGIVVDRIADALFEPLTTRWRRRAYQVGGQPTRDYDHDLLAVIRQAPLASRLAYGRSRLRVCRGWVLNGLMTGIALAAYVLNMPTGQARLGLGLGGGLALLALTWGCFYSYKSLAMTQYRQVLSQAVALEAASSTEALIDATSDAATDPVA